jgi:hypothetical protein
VDLCFKRVERRSRIVVHFQIRRVLRDEWRHLANLCVSLSV